MAFSKIKIKEIQEHFTRIIQPQYSPLKTYCCPVNLELKIAASSYEVLIDCRMVCDSPSGMIGVTSCLGPFAKLEYSTKSKEWSIYSVDWMHSKKLYGKYKSLDQAFDPVVSDIPFFEDDVVLSVLEKTFKDNLIIRIDVSEVNNVS